MSLTISSSGGTSRPLTPAGTHIARCIQIIDLGTQHDSYEGKPRIQKKLRIVFELPNERAVFSDDKGEQCFMIGKEYTASLGEKATLRHHLEGWRGKSFTDEELMAFDLKRIIGKPAMVTVVHQKSKDGSKMMDKIASVSAIPKTKPPMICPKQENPSLVYDIEDGQHGNFEILPEWIQKKILASDEISNPQPADEGEPDNLDMGGEGEEPDIPF